MQIDKKVGNLSLKDVTDLIVGPTGSQVATCARARARACSLSLARSLALSLSLARLRSHVLSSVLSGSLPVSLLPSSLPPPLFLALHRSHSLCLSPLLLSFPFPTFAPFPVLCAFLLLSRSLGDLD